MCPWPPEGLDTGGVEPPGSTGVAQGGTRSNQEAAGQMGKPIACSDLDLGKMSLIKHQIELTNKMPS